MLAANDDRATLTPLMRERLTMHLQQNTLSIWRTRHVRKIKPTPEEEASYGLSVVEDTLWAAVPQVGRPPWRRRRRRRRLDGADPSWRCSPGGASPPARPRTVAA